MSGMLVLVIAFVVLFALLFLGMPIAFAMAAVGVVGFGLLVGWQPAISTIGQVAVDTAMNYNFSTLPLFVVMGALFAHARMADDLYRASYAFVGHRRGGLAMATILACGGFSAVSGSALACAGTMARVSVPIMRRYGYQPNFAAGTVAAGATLDILIPPSTAMIIYAVLTEVNLGKLMVAGFLPGLLTVVLYLLVVVGVAWLRPAWGPAGERSGWDERLRSLRGVWTLVVLFGAVLGGIYLGVFTPTEAAGMGAFGALMIALARRTLTWASLFGILVETLRATTALFMVLMGALLFANLLTVVGGATALDRWIGGLDLGPTGLILVLVAVYLVLGCILEGTVMLLITIPIFFPIVVKAGVDPVWFGIFVVIMGGVALIHPPLGMLLYVVRALVPDIRMNDIFRGVLPYMVADAARLALLIAFPAIVTVLPRLMG